MDHSIKGLILFGLFMILKYGIIDLACYRKPNEIRLLRQLNATVLVGVCVMCLLGTQTYFHYSVAPDIKNPENVQLVRSVATSLLIAKLCFVTILFGSFDFYRIYKEDPMRTLHSRTKSALEMVKYILTTFACLGAIIGLAWFMDVISKQGVTL